MVRVRLSHLVSAVGCALALTAPTQAFGQTYVGVYGGAAIPHEADTRPGSFLFEDITREAAQDGVTVTNLGISLSDTEFDAGWLIGGRVGYWLESLPFLAVEGELYSSFPSVSTQGVDLRATMVADGSLGAASVVVPVREADMEVLTLGLNLIARYPYSALQPYGGVGVGLVRGTIEDVRLAESTTLSIDGTSFTLDAPEPFYALKGKDDWVWALQLMGGVRGFVSDRVALFVEYKYVDTKFELPPITVDYDASHVLGGIEFFFGPGVREK